MSDDARALLWELLNRVQVAAVTFISECVLTVQQRVYDWLRGWTLGGADG